MRRLLVLSLFLLACSRPKPVVWIAGDLHLGSGKASVLDALKPVVKDAPGIVNLEGPVGQPPASSLGLKLANAPESVADLKSQGIRVAGIANNHADDLGEDGRRQTREVLQANGILPAGLGAGPAVLDVGGTKVVVTQHDLTTGVPKNLATDLKAARPLGDVLVALFHVTGPALYLPRPELRDAVQIALDSGAKVIAAHGTHSLAPLEWRGDAVIAWGLGNLAFACDCTDEDDGLVLLLKLDGGKIAEAGVVPIAAGLQGKPLALAEKPDQIDDLLEAIGTKPLDRKGPVAWLPR